MNTEVIAVSIINLGNISVGVICEKTPSGLYKIQNMFGDELNIFLLLEECNIPTSQVVVLKKSDILKLSNINYDRIIQSIKQFRSQEHYFVTNILVLEMLAAFDEVDDRSILNAAIKLSKWLHNQCPDDDCYLLNWYQAVYRKNKNDKHIDIKRLRYIIETADRADIKAGAAIVIGDKDLAQRLLEDMDDNARNEFLQYPIIKLMA